MKPNRGTIRNWRRIYNIPGTDQYYIAGTCDRDRFPSGSTNIYTSQVVNENLFEDGNGWCETLNSRYALQDFKGPDKRFTEEDIRYEAFLATLPPF